MVVALIHGGPYEPMNAASFWAETGVVDALSARGVDVVAPERLSEPQSWAQDAEHVAEQLADVGRPVPVVSGSNGHSTAARLAVAHPELVERLAFLPAGDRRPEPGPQAGARVRIAETSGDQVATSLLAGDNLRGVRNDELASIAVPVAVMAAQPDDPVHRQATAEALLRLPADSVPLAPMPGFEP
jgi:pimeloyl-ACP methyl ester carboxylesterase